MLARITIIQRIKSHGILSNSFYLILTTVGGSFFGYVFWIIVSRDYSPAELGLGAAYISGIIFLANLGDVGLGITYIRFGSTMGEKSVEFLNSILIAVFSCTLFFALIFVITAPIFEKEIYLFPYPSWTMLIFIVAAISFSIAQFLDKFFITFESNHYSFVRNLIANLIRIGLILVLTPSRGENNLMIAVGFGAFITIIPIIVIYIPKFLPGYILRINPDLSLIWGKARYSLSNFLSQFLWNAPPLLYPIIILSLLGTVSNAHFYINWMIANVLFIIPTAISTSVFAKASSPEGIKDRRYWRYLFFTLVGLIPVVAGFGVFSKILLSVFGNEYINGNKLLFYLLISVFPYTCNTFILVKFRILQYNQGVVWLSVLIASISIFLISFFGIRHGLDGVGIGWLTGQLIGVLLSLILLGRFWLVRSRKGSSEVATVH